MTRSGATLELSLLLLRVQCGSLAELASAIAAGLTDLEWEIEERLSGQEILRWRRNCEPPWLASHDDVCGVHASPHNPVKPPLFIKDPEHGQSYHLPLCDHYQVMLKFAERNRAAGRLLVSSPIMKIRDMIALIEAKDWRRVRTRGSHRQYHHPERPGTVTIAGKPGKDLSQDMIGSILKQAGAYQEGLAMKRYVVVIEETGDGYGAFVPDLPGCVAAGDTYEETKRLIREAIPFHIEGLHTNGDPIPEPTTRIEFVDAETAA